MAGDDKATLADGPSGPPQLSRTVVERVLSSGDALLVSDLGEDDGLALSDSLIRSRVATLLASPLPLESGRALVYLDRRGAKTPFTASNLAVLAEAARAAAGA